MHNDSSYIITLPTTDFVRIANVSDEKSLVQGRVQLHLEHANRLEVASSSVFVTRGTFKQISIDSGSIGGGIKAEKLCVAAGKSNVDGGTRTEIGELQLAVGSTLAINGRVISEKILVAEGRRGSARVTLINDRNPSVIRVKQIIDCRIEIGARVGIEILNEARNLSVSGSGSVLFLEGSAGHDIELQGVTLSVEPHSVLLGLKGDALVRRAQDAHLVGAPDQIFTIGVAPDAHDKPFERATLQGLRIPSTTKGRQQLSALDDAWHFTPYIGDLPVFGWKYRRPFVASLKRDRLDLVTLANEREHVRSLTKLASTKGAPGSVRTKLAWAAYRIHNLTALSGWERASLSLYRLIGYGERAVPAAATWLLVSFLVIPIGHGFDLEFSRDGFQTLVHTWWNYVLSPFYLLNLAGRAEPLGARELFARILVAIPFVTAVIAARKYVKTDRESS